MSDEALCPLCNGPNECGSVKGEETCWCFTASISDEVLASVPPEAVGKRCVCATCARG
jgi:hypothetical protein